MDMGLTYSGMNILTTMYGNLVSNDIAQTQADTANIIRGDNNATTAVQNERDASIVAIKQWQQGVHNERVYEGLEQDQLVSETNYNRAKDASARASFSDQIQYAEQEGRLAASAAASGISGSIVDTLNAATRMRQGISNTNTANNNRLADSDHQAQLNSTRLANMDQLDYSLILNNPKSMDYLTNTAVPKSLLTGVSSKDVKTVGQGLDFSFQPKADGSDSLDAFLTLNNNFGTSPP